jgi:hypothetical protein
MKSENQLKLHLSVLLVKNYISLNSPYDEISQKLQSEFNSSYTFDELQIAMYELQQDNEEYRVSLGDFYEGFNL